MPHSTNIDLSMDAIAIRVVLVSQGVSGWLIVGVLLGGQIAHHHDLRQVVMMRYSASGAGSSAARMRTRTSSFSLAPPW